MGQPFISVVIPAFNEADNLRELNDRLMAVLSATGHEYEVLIVDDGSTDATADVLHELSAEDEHLRYITFTRNFGHQVAVKAGLDNTNGLCVVMLDSDLQHPPEMIPAMLARWHNGYEVVNMVRSDEALPFTKRATSRLFYWLVNALSDTRIEPGSADFRLLDHRVVAVLKEMGERSLFLRGLIPWLGFRQVNLPYQPGERRAGTAKYDLRRMVLLALSGLTSSSSRPLHLSTALGVVMSVLAMIYACYALAVKFLLGTTISGWTSLIIGVMLLGGVQLLVLGIVGEYLGRVFMEVKGRPLYVVRAHNLSKQRSAEARCADKDSIVPVRLP